MQHFDSWTGAATNSLGIGPKPLFAMQSCLASGPVITFLSCRCSRFVVQDIGLPEIKGHVYLTMLSMSLVSTYSSRGFQTKFRSESILSFRSIAPLLFILCCHELLGELASEILNYLMRSSRPCQLQIRVNVLSH